MGDRRIGDRAIILEISAILAGTGMKSAPSIANYIGDSLFFMGGGARKGVSDRTTEHTYGLSRAFGSDGYARNV